MRKTTAKIRAAEKLLKKIAAKHAPAAFATSLGAEDMVITDLICSAGIDIGIFSLDTGRLPEETHRLMEETRRRYGCRIRVYSPAAASVESFVEANGPNAFYHSVNSRKACCFIRKVEPLRRALKGKKAWITGLRREQTPTRKDLPVAAWDGDNGLHKFNPLADWSTEDVWTCIREFDIPYNTLHDQGYPSIGCAPCTRAVSADEDIRAGRWWWENPQSRECGLHVKG